MSDANLEQKGYEQVTGLAASKGLDVPKGARLAIVQAEAQAVRWRDDGTDPTAAIGVRLAAGTDFFYTGELSAIRFIEEAVGAKLNVSYYA